MSNHVRYAKTAEDTSRHRSPAIWRDIWRDKNDDGSSVFEFYDDFANFPQHISAQNVQQYASYIDTGVTILQLASQSLSTQELGVIEVAGNDADNDEGQLITGGDTGPLAVISDAAGALAVVFECRVKKASIADNALAFFIGLAEPGLAGANALVDDTGALADNNFIGFQTLHAAGETVAATYRANGQAVTDSIADVETMVADTYVKLGFKYDPHGPDAKKIRWYVNGKEQATYVTATNIAAVTFPDGDDLALFWATKVGAAAESKAQLDWWGCGVSLKRAA